MKKNKFRKKKKKLQKNSTEIQAIIRDYFEKPYGNKMDNLEKKMVKFLESTTFQD